MATLLKKGGAYFFGRRFEKPLALGIGQDAAMQQPLAIAIGLVAQLPLVLIVLPSLLVLLRVATPRESAA